MNRLHILALTPLVLVLACGQKTAERPPQTTTTPPAPVAPSTLATAPDAAPVTVAEVAPSTSVEVAADTTVAAPEPETVAADTTAAPSSDASAAVVEHRAADEPEVETEVEAAAGSGLSSSMDRMRAGRGGCIGFSPDGNRALIGTVTKLGDETIHRLAWVDLVLGTMVVPEEIDPKIVYDVIEANDLTKGWPDLVPCRELRPQKGRVTVELPDDIITVTDDRGIRITRAGHEPVSIDIRESQGLDAVYMSPFSNAIVIRSKREAYYGRGPTLRGVSARELGLGCVPEPVGGPATPVELKPWEPPVSPRGCLAMTANGRAAAFYLYTHEVDGGTGETQSRGQVKWLGPDAAPAIDLGCYAGPKRCSAEQRAALAEAGKKLGLVECPRAPSLQIGGHAFRVETDDEHVFLRLNGGQVFMAPLVIGGVDGWVDKLSGTYQVPDGPAYFWITAERMGTDSETHARWVDPSSYGWCRPLVGPDPGERGWPIVGFKASSELPPNGGYTFAAKNLFDGDTTTSWQPGGEREPWFEIDFGRERLIGIVRMANGFQLEDASGDLFMMNARASDVTLVFDDKSVQRLYFTPTERGYQLHHFPPVASRTIKVIINSKHAGTKWADDLAISEFRVSPATWP